MNDKVRGELAACGALLVRRNKHEVWRLPDGQNFVIAVSSSDQRAEANNLARLKRALGQQKFATTVGERRRPKPGRKSEAKADLGGSFNSVLADQLRLSGAVEAKLRAELGEASARMVELEEELALVRAALAEVLLEPPVGAEPMKRPGWLGRLREWWG